MVASSAAACGGGSTVATPDAFEVRWSWAFRDADGNDVGCPPGVTTVEMTTWTWPSGPGDSCTNRPNATVDRQESFPCAPGEAVFNTAGIPRMDFKLDDGRVYARVFPAPLVSHHVDVVVPRGFVALHWSFYNSTLMMDRWCDSYSKVTTTWLGAHERFDCGEGAPTTAILPAQPIGTAMFDVIVTGFYEACGNVFQKKTVSLTVLPDQTVDATVQFTTSQ